MCSKKVGFALVLLVVIRTAMSAGLQEKVRYQAIFNTSDVSADVAPDTIVRCGTKCDSRDCAAVEISDDSTCVLYTELNRSMIANAGPHASILYKTGEIVVYKPHILAQTNHIGLAAPLFCKCLCLLSFELDVPATQYSIYFKLHEGASFVDTKNASLNEVFRVQLDAGIGEVEMTRFVPGNGRGPSTNHTWSPVYSSRLKVQVFLGSLDVDVSVTSSSGASNTFKYLAAPACSKANFVDVGSILGSYPIYRIAFESKANTHF